MKIYPKIFQELNPDTFPNKKMYNTHQFKKVTLAISTHKKMASYPVLGEVRLGPIVLSIIELHLSEDILNDMSGVVYCQMTNCIASVSVNYVLM